MSFETLVLCMYVTIKQNNGDKLTIYGITDFQKNGDKITVFTPEETYGEVDEILGSVEESLMDVSGLAESMLMSMSEGEVIVYTGNISVTDKAFSDAKKALEHEGHADSIEKESMTSR